MFPWSLGKAGCQDFWIFGFGDWGDVRIYVFVDFRISRFWDFVILSIAESLALTIFGVLAFLG